MTIETASERESELVEEFEYMGRKCVITKETREGGIGISDKGQTLEEYHNGYIRVSEEVDINGEKMGGEEGEGVDVTFAMFKDDIETDELSFSGELEGAEGYFFGFDSAHFQNVRNPETQTKESVKERTKKMVKEFYQKNIFSRVKEMKEGNES